MKKLLVILLATGMLAACNNGKDNNGGGGGGLFGGKTGGGGGTGGGTKGWSTADRNKFMNDCTTGMQGTGQDGQTICNCVLGKMEASYASLAEADQKGGAAAGEKAVKECMAGGGGTGGEIGDDPRRGQIDGPAAGNWTAQQKQTFIGQCVPSAQQAQGLTNQQATSYCECMTNKVAAKFTWEEANRLTAEEFGKPEWQQAMMDCRPGADY